MDTITTMMEAIPREPLIVGAIGLALVAALIVASLIRRQRFARRIDRFLTIPGSRKATDYFTDAELLRRSRLLERRLEAGDERLVPALELDRLWTARLQQKERPADFRRVLRYAPATGLFSCFLVALGNRRLAAALRSYLSDHPDFLVLRRLALSGRGEPFDGRRAHAFFSERIDEIREMTGDPEWPSRYFATKVLLHDTDERSDRALGDAFGDPHPLIRRTVVSEHQGSGREELYGRVLDAFLHDPVHEVRSVARERIRRDFSDLYGLDPGELEPEEALHVVDLLDPNHPDDVNAALELLSGTNRELCLAAARFLTRSATLRRLFRNVTFSDRTELERVRSLLRRAISVHVVDFLRGVTDDPGPATLLLGAELLAEHGPQEYIVEVAERVFRLQTDATENHREIYHATISAIGARGAEDAHRLLAGEISHRRDRPDLLALALQGVSAGHDAIYRDTLIHALHDETFPAREALRAALLKLDTPLVLSTCIDVITAGRERFAHQVRIDALLTLGALKLPYTLQDILEHLHVLPVDEARAFTRTLDEFDSKELERKIRALLQGVDGSIRAAVIAALPATGKKTFLAEIKQAQSDADPDVRIAATWALVDYEETRAVNQAAGMLRDPVERVRRNVARALAVGGGPSALDALRRTLADEHEVESVKEAAVEGLGACVHPDAVDVLVDQLQAEGVLLEAAETALACKTQAASITRLVERFKDADPALRDRISRVFQVMGESGEQVIREVLEEEISGLHAYLAEILEKTGYVESRIRMLSHRDPRVRREAAGFLALVASEAAFRGIVLAARDPDTEVRVQVTKALERLAGEDGKEILRTLENDPDRRIRKYTHWALERLEAKSL